MYRVVVYIVLSLPPPSNCNPEAKLMSDESPSFVPANHAPRLKHLLLHPNTRRLSEPAGAFLLISISIRTAS
jgi:hypothetical protein